MRKVMLLAAMLAMVLAAAAPAFAQATIGDETQVVDCSQVQAAVGAQYGDANAAADDESVAIANISQDLDITQNQVNACLGGIDGDVAQGGEGGGNIVDFDDDGVDDDGDGAVDEDEGSASASASAEGDDEGSASASAASEDVAELPETCGASLLALGAGALLVAGGLVARRIVR